MKSAYAAMPVLVLALIGLHLFWRFGLKADFADWPLFPVLAFGGISQILNLVRAVRRRELHADLLAGVSVATSVVLHEYLAGTVVVLMFLTGKTLEDYAVKSASSVLEALAKRMPSVAHLRRGANLLDVRAEDLLINDSYEIFPYELCPADGVVTEGHGSMNESYLTGEPFAIDKAPGSSVISGAVNGESPLVVTVVRRAADSRYAKIVEVLRESEKNKPRLRRLAERLGVFYTPLALLIAGAAWLVSGDASRFLAVLVVATPCPLLIGIPVAILGSISLAAKRGIIVKNPGVLEQIGRCRTAIFDKTGTLTRGEPRCSGIAAEPGVSKSDLLAWTASLERYSKHPLAAAILGEARREGVALHEASEIKVVPGRGLQGTVAGRHVEITGRNALKEEDAKRLPVHSGGLECAVLVDGRFAGTFHFQDAPREEGGSFIRHLGPRHRFDRTIIVSGDRESEVRYLADQVGIAEIHAGKSPEEKLAIVNAETSKANTLYVGDGINDAPALMAATVGVAIGANSDITSQAAGAVIMDSSLAKVDELMHIGIHLRRVALQSAAGGMALSVLGMFAAAGGYIAPVTGALLQEGIDLLAVLNALRAAFPPKTMSDFSERV